MSVLDLARPHLKGMKPYSSARSLAAEADVYLDANESPRVLYAASAGLNRYPSPQPPALVREASRYYAARAENVLVTRGADEGIDLLVRAFVAPGREDILIAQPTYGVYAIAARLNDCGVREVPLDAARGFALNVEAVLAAARAHPVKLVFVCQPNNPTANGFPPAAIEALAAGLEGRALLVVDEAYLEFSDLPSAVPLIARFPHVVVLKTLSKAWGLAGARCGFMLADPDVVGLMQTVRAPYPISGAAAHAVEVVFNAAGEAAMRLSVAAILSERARLERELRRLECVETLFPSAANFLLARLKRKDAIFAALKTKGILIRDRGAEPGLAGCVRITVGLPEENDSLLKILGGLDG
ncbi:MAG: histidinol-phosphate transaminase [Elusimicrobiota bacterium]